MQDDAVVSIAQDLGVALTDRGNQAYYEPGRDAITMPLRTSFVSPADYDTVLLHEIGHATGHPSRLNRSLGGHFGSTEYAKEELRAEISAAMNARAMGIAFEPSAVNKAERSGLENSAAYLRHWLGMLPEEDRKIELMAAISSAQKISDYVLEFTLKEDRAEEIDRHVSVGPRMRL